MDDRKTYILEVTESELEIIHDTFRQLTKDNVSKWLNYVKENEYVTPECFKQWLKASDCNSIRIKAKEILSKEILGIEVDEEDYL